MNIIVVLAAGAFLGGFINGLAGFGTGLAALGLWLHVVDPVIAAALVVICSVLGQAQSLYKIRHSISWRRVWPFLVGGIIGVPIGVAALKFIEPKTLKVSLGVFLIAYTCIAINFPCFSTMSRGGRFADGLVGFGGGALGGVAGLSGALPTIWCGLRGWNADTQRGVYQPYNLTILGIVLCVYFTQGILTEQVWRFALVCLPATILGVYSGIRIYGLVNDRQFRVLVLWLLLASGIVLIVLKLHLLE